MRSVARSRDRRTRRTNRSASRAAGLRSEIGAAAAARDDTRTSCCLAARSKSTGRRTDVSASLPLPPLPHVRRVIPTPIRNLRFELDDSQAQSHQLRIERSATSAAVSHLASPRREPALLGVSQAARPSGCTRAPSPRRDRIARRRQARAPAPMIGDRTSNRATSETASCAAAYHTVNSQRQRIVKRGGFCGKGALKELDYNVPLRPRGCPYPLPRATRLASFAPHMRGKDA